jgi:predicted SnoaL-like aldol condensation-catalyzing enzyme
VNPNFSLATPAVRSGNLIAMPSQHYQTLAAQTFPRQPAFGLAGTIAWVLTAVIFSAGLGGCGKASNPPETAPVAAPSAAAVAADPTPAASRLLSSLGTADQSPLDLIDSQKFVQHDLSIPDGKAGFKTFLARLPKDSYKVTPVRLFHDGDVVVAQSVVEWDGPKVAFDIFRFDHGKVVEHWDNLQPRNADPNQSGHTMTDGPTAVADESQTEANKALVQKFIEQVIIGEKVDGFDSFFDGDKYIQHDPGLGDGTSDLKSILTGYAASGTPTGYTNLVTVLGQGNFVLAITSGSAGGKPAAFYDLFRVDHGKLAEHWDTIQELPPAPEWKNSNGKFDGFPHPAAH